MFGYVRPYKPELKVYELEQFKACYCSLCHVLGKNYGAASRFILNYDFTFLAMLLWPAAEKPEYCMRRCIASPCRRKCVAVPSDALDLCAAYSIILTWWKLKDAVQDEGFPHSFGARLGLLTLRRAYRRARAKFPDFDQTVRYRLQELNQLEQAGEPSLDRAADRFAVILSAAAAELEGNVQRRPVESLLYHLGRWIYIVDAYDDLEADTAAGRYNPIASRYGAVDGNLSPDDRRALQLTIDHSMNLVGAAYELLPENAWSGIIRNIVYLGMPYVSQAVLSGTFQNTKGSPHKQTGEKI